MQAWLQVLGAFFLWFNTWGLINAYGAFQSFYTVDLLQDKSRSAIAWIGSVQSCLLLLVGALTGPIFDAGYFRTLVVVGSGLTVFGMMMASIATKYWEVMLAQGVCVGLGAGCLFVPSTALLSTYFSSKMTIAMGLSATGSGVGGTILPIVFHRLQPRVGFPWATRTIAFICLATLIVPNAVMRVRMLPPQRRKLFDLSAWRDPAYDLYVLGCFVAFIGTFTPYFYIGLYALNLNVTSETTAFYLLAVITAGGVFGRVVPNLLAAKFGMYNVLVPCGIFSGVMAFAFMGAKSLASIIVVAVLYGVFSGALLSLAPAIAVQLAPNRALIGNRMGMAFASVAGSFLVGSPIAGTILDHHGFSGAFAFAGATSIAGAFILAASRGFHGGWRIMKKL
ncbi:MFS general substrate transporter [Exophiala viscosa]|uniref:MFS general substrate transporter n=1 Tax=Exophiala viscosa TaxID=2486360 RepID=A0AAN6II20_9EURO|nr:MFS general substrate transporter [Exophiala viscosa]